MSWPELRLMDSYRLRYLIRPCGSTAGDQSPPLLCFLHGYAEGAPLDIFDGLTRHGPLRPVNPPTFKDRFVIVAPQLPVRGDFWNRYADTVRQIVLDEAKSYGCDLRRLYLIGFSFGGNGFSIYHPLKRRFGPLHGRLILRGCRRRQSPIPIWLSLGEISRLQARSFIHKLVLESAETCR